MIAPQAFRIVSPSVATYLIGLFKDSSIASTIIVGEIVFQAQAFARQHPTAVGILPYIVRRVDLHRAEHAGGLLLAQARPPHAGGNLLMDFLHNWVGYLPEMLSGLKLSLLIAAVSIVVGYPLGLGLSLMTARRTWRPAPSGWPSSK